MAKSKAAASRKPTETERLQALAVDLRTDPEAYGPTWLARCRELAEQVRSMIRQGVDEDPENRERWSAAVTELRQHVALAEHEHKGIFGKWINRDPAIVDAITTLRRIWELFDNTPPFLWYFPEACSPEHQPLCDLLDRFLGVGQQIKTDLPIAYTQNQQRILAVLKHNALQKKELCKAACILPQHLYKPENLGDLKKRGEVLSDKKMGGYYRPDFPPHKEKEINRKTQQVT